MAEEHKRVVCIEDEPEMIDLVKLILGRKGFDLTGAMGGREGLEAVRRIKPDLVLLDLMMPDMDGWEVYQQMKADAELMNIPVIVVTADEQDVVVGEEDIYVFLGLEARILLQDLLSRNPVLER